MFKHDLKMFFWLPPQELTCKINGWEEPKPSLQLA